MIKCNCLKTLKGSDYMTHSDYTRNILNIKDENIYFYENCYEEYKIGGVLTKIFHGVLTYCPEKCPKCDCINSNNSIIKWAFKKNCKVKIPKVSNFNAILFLDKQRFFCKNCHKTFVAETSLVDFHKQVSNNSRLAITLDLMEKSSEKDIAKRNNVSSNTVNRILDDISNDPPVKEGGHLPSVLGIDEFKATKDTKSKMAFIIINQNDKNIFDINNSRFSNDIDSYFRNYSYHERNKVQYVTLDLYKPYFPLMHRLFRNAILIPDRFHIDLQIRNALDHTRIKLCLKSNPNYKKLKKYWKLLLKNEDDLDKDNKKYSPNFRKEISEYEIVTYLINTNCELKVTYNLYQGIIKSIKNKDKQKFLNIIHHVDGKVSIYAKKAIKTYLNMEKYIVNAFDYDYSNGITEGTNNLIKCLKRIAFGYRKFSHFKARIMLIKGQYSFEY